MPAASSSVHSTWACCRRSLSFRAFNRLSSHSFRGSNSSRSSLPSMSSANFLMVLFQDSSWNKSHPSSYYVLNLPCQQECKFTLVTEVTNLLYIMVYRSNIILLNMTHFSKLNFEILSTPLIYGLIHMCYWIIYFNMMLIFLFDNLKFLTKF